jgi:hypothetical protein
MKQIPLSQGKIAFVDDEDFDWLNQYKWCAYQPNSKGTYYATRNITYTDGTCSMVQMHREILGLSLGDRGLGDHKDRNGLNNQKHNLRVGSKALNSHNSKLQSNNSSGYRGVYWHKNRSKWVVRIGIHGVPKYCGVYDDVVEAAKVYDKEALQAYGPNVYLNFPIKKQK